MFGKMFNIIIILNWIIWIIWDMFPGSLWNRGPSSSDSDLVSGGLWILLVCHCFLSLINLFNSRIITLQSCDFFCHISTWIGHRYTCVSPILNTPPTSFSTPSLWVVQEHCLWMPCFMHRTRTGHLFYIQQCTFQCYSLKSSHPSLLPLSLKVCSLHLCLLCYPACRIVSTIFLNSIYIYIH